MVEFWKLIQAVFTAMGGWIGWFIGGCDGLFIALVIMVVLDYIVGVMRAAVDKRLSSAIGLKGIFKKTVELLMVGVANIIDVNVLGQGAMLRTAVIFLMISNEGLSLLEHAAYLGVPIPAKLKDVLEVLHDKSEEGK